MGVLPDLELGGGLRNLHRKKVASYEMFHSASENKLSDEGE
jgi:hypothetical protein